MSEVTHATDGATSVPRQEPPRERIMTRKGALIELLIVTAGVLIALSSDTVREWRDNHRLAVEARSNILSEIAANKRRLDESLAQAQINQKDYVAAHRGAENLLAGRPFGTDSINFGNRLANVTDAAYATAQITGAFRYMDYEEVRNFAGLYDLQVRYEEFEDEVTRNIAALTAPMVLGDGPDELGRPELEEWKRGIERAVGNLRIRSEIGKLLSQAYAALLDEGESDE